MQGWSEFFFAGGFAILKYIMYRARSKRAERRRLILTYTFVPVFVIGVVVLLVFYMLGYRFNLADHKVTQGGLMQLDSQPGGAMVTVDTYRLPGRTATRYDAPAGLHTVTMQRDGYVPWQKSVTVEPGKILWLNYARLIPQKINQTTALSYKALSSSVASPGGQVIAMFSDETKPELELISLGDTVRQTKITLPTALYQTSAKSRFAVMTLSGSGRYTLVKHTKGQTHEWLLIDTRTPNQSRNLTTLIGQQTDQPVFSTGSEQKLYALVDRTLRLVDADKQTMSAPLVNDVAEMSQNAQGVIAYVTYASGTPRQRVAGYYTPGAAKPHVIRAFYDDGQSALRLRIAEYAGDQYIVLQYGTTIEISQAQLLPSDDDHELQLTSVATLAVPDGADYVSFSPTARFVVSQHASTYLTYDLELNSLSTTSLKGESTVKSQLAWLDSYNVWSDRDGMLRLYEFDGANAHTIGAIDAGQAVVLGAGGKYIYAFQSASDKTAVNLVRFHLRVEQ